MVHCTVHQPAKREVVDEIGTTEGKMMRISLSSFLLSAICIALAMYSTAAITQACTFHGEIVHSSDYSKIVIDRAEPGRENEKPGQYTPLFEGDVILLQGDAIALIRSEPGQRPQKITAGDGRVMIGSASDCQVSNNFMQVIINLPRGIIGGLRGPVPDQPVATYPRGGDGAALGIEIDLVEPQWVSADLSTIHIFWRGLNAQVSLIDDAGTELLTLQSESTPHVEGKLLRTLRPGETLRLVLETELGTRDWAVRVSPQADRPRPEELAGVDNLSEEERAIYAMWLATQGPPEWRLQGMSLLAKAAQTNYMAWKLWRGIWANQDN